jgi:hypothetical protein
MEEKKLKEIEAKLYQLLMQVDKSQKTEATPAKKTNGVRVIRRRKGHADLHFT